MNSSSSADADRQAVDGDEVEPLHECEADDAVHDERQRLPPGRSAAAAARARARATSSPRKRAGRPELRPAQRSHLARLERELRDRAVDREQRRGGERHRVAERGTSVALLRARDGKGCIDHGASIRPTDMSASAVAVRSPSRSLTRSSLSPTLDPVSSASASKRWTADRRPRGVSPRLPGHLRLGGDGRGRSRRRAARRQGAPAHAGPPLREGEPLPRARLQPRAAAPPAAPGRGEGRPALRAIGWDEALDEIAGRLRRDRRRARRRGGAAVQLHGHAGHRAGCLARPALLLAASARPG